MELRKGIYFSFDALLALSVMSASLVAITVIMDTTSDDFDVETREIQQNQEISRDVMNAASTQKMSILDEDLQEELIEETIMTEDDFQRTITEGTVYLWAAGNRSHARQVIDEFARPKMGDREFKIEVSERGEDLPTVYNTTEMPEEIDTVVTTSTIVSGFRLNETSEGYRARARVLEARAQVAEIEPISPAGTLLSGPPGNTDFDVRQNIEIDGESVEGALLDIAIADGPAGGQRELYINGEETEFGEELYSEGEVTYYRNNVSDIIDEPGDYEIFISLSSHPDIEQGARLYPGTRLEVNKTTEATEIESERREEEITVKDVHNSAPGGEETGIFSIEDFRLPENSEINDANLSLVIEGMEPGCQQHEDEEWDVQVIVNGEELFSECSSAGTFDESINITENINAGNNIVTIFANHDGEDEFWGGQETRIVGDPDEEDRTVLEVDYDQEPLFSQGSFRASLAEEVAEEEDNPLHFEQDFEYSDVVETNIYLSQALGERTEVLVDSGDGFEQEFDSEDIGQIPTLISLDPNTFDYTAPNEVRIEDDNLDADILPFTLFERVVEAPTSVGYGAIFDSPEEAQEDAVERLEERLGALINAEEIDIDDDDDVETIGGQPRLWGPSNLKLIVWEEEDE